MHFLTLRFSTLLLTMVFCVVGCQNDPPKAGLPPEKWQYQFQDVGKLFGKDVVLWGSKKKSSVSREIWYGALEALSQFPLKIIDPQAGVLQTDWCVLEKHPDERFQIRVTILPSESIDFQCVRVSVTRQVFSRKQWMISETSDLLESHLKNDILLNARSYASGGRKMISESHE